MQNSQDNPEKKTMVPSNLDELLEQKLNETEALKKLLSRLESLNTENAHKAEDTDIKKAG